MFNNADRFPTGPALPSGIVTVGPWALRRLRPYPDAPVEYVRVELDPATQTARYLDEAGLPVTMAKHGTSTGTSPVTGTGNPSDGRGGGDTDRGNDSDQ